MTLHVGVSSAWKRASLFVGVGGDWKTVNEAWVGVSGVWKRFTAWLSGTIGVDTDGAFFGYDNFSVPFGTLDNTTFNGQTISGVTWTISPSGVLFFRLQGTGITNSDATFTGVSVGGLAVLLRSSASYTANDGAGNTRWSWGLDTSTLTGPNETLLVI